MGFIFVVNPGLQAGFLVLYVFAENSRVKSWLAH